MKNFKLWVPPNPEVLCHQNQIVYSTVAEAALRLELDHRAIRDYLKNRRRTTVHGYTFEYIDKERRTIDGRPLR